MAGHRLTGMSLVPEAQHYDASALFRAHANFVANFLHRLGVPAAEIDDLVQEVFLVAHRRGGFFEDGRAKPTTWLAGISVRIASSSRRKQRRCNEAPNQDLVSTAQTHNGCPARSAETMESLQRITLALAPLDEERRAIFVLFEIEGESCGNIASIFDIPVGTVYSRLHSARKQFKLNYARLCDAPTKRQAPATLPHEVTP